MAGKTRLLRSNTKTLTSLSGQPNQFFNNNASYKGQEYLVSWWSGIQSYSLSNLLDIEGDNNLTMTSITEGTSKFGSRSVIGSGAIELNGTSSVASGTSTSLKLAKNPGFTVMAWVNTDSASTDQTIIQVGDSLTEGWALAITSAGKFTARINSTTVVEFSGTVIADEWRHVIMTYDGSSVKLITESATDSSFLTATVIYDTTPSLRIGARDNAGSDTDFFDGTISEVRVFKGVLPNTQLTEERKVFHNQFHIPRLLAYWSMEDAFPSTPTTVEDDYRGTLDGTLSGGVSENSSGKYGVSLTFDGTDDYVTITDARSRLMEDRGITISAWVKLTTIGATRTIVAKGDTVNEGWILQVDSAGKPQLKVNSQTSSTASTALTADTWHHVVGQYNGTTITVYLDGTSVSTTSYSASITHSDDILYIGRNQSGDYWLGQIDEVQLYGEELSGYTLTRINAARPMEYPKSSTKSGSDTGV